MRKIDAKTIISLIVFFILMGILVVTYVTKGSYAADVLEVPNFTDIELLNNDKNQVKISFNTPQTDDQYKVEIYNKTTEETTKTEAFSSEYIIDDLTPGNTYEFALRLCKEENEEYYCSEYSSPKTIEIKGEEEKPLVLSEITGVKFTKLTTNSITVVWNKLANANSYIVKYKEKSSNNWQTLNTNNTSLTVSKLKQNTAYSFEIFGVNNNITSPSSGIKNVMTTLSVPNITGFNVKATSYNNVKISWNRNPDRNAVYQLYVSTNGRKWHHLKTISNYYTTHNHPKRGASRWYYYKMVATDNRSQPGKTFKSGTTAVKKVKTPAKSKSTHITVSIKDQRLWFYKKGRLVVTSPVVTGTVGKHNTPKGTFKIRKKARSAYLVGRDYVSFVNYWMLIDSRTQVGLHDASWRSKFGGNIYKRNGSHGCINMPKSAARIIYQQAPTGTKVYVK